MTLAASVFERLIAERRTMKDDEILDSRKGGPDQIIGVTDGGCTVIWLILVLILAAVLVVGFFSVTSI